MPAVDLPLPLPRHDAGRRSPRRPPLAPWLVPLAIFAALAAHNSLVSDPAAVAEGRFLALLAAGVLAAVAALAAAAGGRQLGMAALLVTAVAWIADHGPTRGAVVTLVLVLALAAALAAAGRRRGLEDPGVTIPAALALQLLARGDLLLPPLLDPRTLVSVLVLPTAAGLALSLLAARRGGRRTLVAGAVVLVLAPGWNVTTTLALLALAAGTLAADRRLSPAVRVLAAATLLVPLVWGPLPGAVIVLAGLALGSRGRLALLAPAAAPGLLFFAPAGGWGAAVDAWVGGLVLLPALVLVPAEDRVRALSGLVLAFVGARVGAGPEALAAGLGLAALATPGGAAGRIQGTWCAVLAAGTTLLAASPWARSAPRQDLLHLLGLGDGVFALALTVGVLAVAASLMDRLDRRRPAVLPAALPPAAPVALVLLLVALALVPAAAPTTLLVDRYRALTLDEGHPHWRHEIPPRNVAAVVLDSHLVHGVTLAPGTPVATVELEDPAGQVIAGWRLAAGDDTAEWAAARPDVAAQPGFVAPPPWLSQVAPEGTFFGRRFRSRRETAAPVTAAAITLRRDPGLPPAVRLVVYHLEVRP